MDLNKIFTSFSKNGDNQVDFKQTPTFHILMFKKKLNNHINNKFLLISSVKSKHPELKEEEILKASHYVGFNSAFQHIKYLDLDDDFVISSINENSNKELNDLVTKSIKFFEGENIEEYEKCAFLQKFKNIIEKNLW